MRFDKCIRKAKEIARMQRLTPFFSPNEGGTNEFNCYAYALMLSDIDWGKNEVAPGFLSGQINLYDDVYWDHITCDGIVEYVKDDLKILGRKMKKDSFESKVVEGTYKIAIFVNENGFHFIRQNIDETWSEKCGWEGKVQYIYPRYIPDYNLVGVYRISKRAK